MKSVLGIGVLLSIISISAASWCFERGYVLYYGDAEAHLNIARRILDSRTPGPEQIGTVWLPLPHLLMIPFVMRDDWWRSGVAGTIPSAGCFVLAGTFLFAAARRMYASAAGALAVALLFALNPNMLYLQSTPMTEPVFAASLAALLWATLWFHDSQSPWAVLAAAVASNAASLTRYEGWFLIPFVSLYLLWTAKRKWLAVLFGALASLAPLAWIAHNRFYTGNALEFFNGPYSAMAIQKVPYPGQHDWWLALSHYSAAARLVAGWPLILIGGMGILRRITWPIVFLALPSLFYVWSVHSSGTPIFVPPYGWYNTRYGLAALPLAAFAGGSLIMLLPSRSRWAAALLLGVVPILIWALSQTPAITWKESQLNSAARRAWTKQAAEFLEPRYKPGSGLMVPFGDLTGILREAGIPLRESLHEGNGPAWLAAISRPDLFLHEEWVVADKVRVSQFGPHYQLRKRIIVEGASPVEIYQRQ